MNDASTSVRTDTAASIAKGTDGYIVSNVGEKNACVRLVTVQMLRSERTRVYTTNGDDVRVEQFYLDIEDAGAALYKQTLAKKSALLALVASIDEMLAEMDNGDVRVVDRRRGP